MAVALLVTGGTGTLGRSVVSLLRESGRGIRVLSRHGGATANGVEHVTGDLATGANVDAAVEGISTIVHCAGTARGDETKARHLVEAASRAGVRHLVFISVVGAERVPVVSFVDRALFGYFASKRAAERVISESGLPWTTLRATQFHELILLTLRGMATLPVIPVPAGVRFQPVDTADVAARLVELALGTPAGLVPDIAGPSAFPMIELVRGFLRASHKRRILVPLPLPGRAAAALRAGANLPTGGSLGRRTWEEFLASHLGSAQARSGLSA